MLCIGFYIYMYIFDLIVVIMEKKLEEQTDAIKRLQQNIKTMHKKKANYN